METSITIQITAKIFHLNKNQNKNVLSVWKKIGLCIKVSHVVTKMMFFNTNMKFFNNKKAITVIYVSQCRAYFELNHNCENLILEYKRECSILKTIKQNRLCAFCFWSGDYVLLRPITKAKRFTESQIWFTN